MGHCAVGTNRGPYGGHLEKISKLLLESIIGLLNFILLKNPEYNNSVSSLRTPQITSMLDFFNFFILFPFTSGFISFEEITTFDMPLEII